MKAAEVILIPDRDSKARHLILSPLQGSDNLPVCLLPFFQPYFSPQTPLPFDSLLSTVLSRVEREVLSRVSCCNGNRVPWVPTACP